MTYDTHTAARIRRIFSRRRNVVEKRMVGGLSFIVNGKMCCGVTGTALMIRVGSAARDRVLALKHVRPMQLGGRPLAGFVCVDPAGFRSGRALAAWIKRGVTFVMKPTEPG